MADYAARILQLVTEPDYTPMTLKAMARQLEVGTDDYAEFRQAVKALVKEGKLELARDKTLRRPDHSNAIIGLFRRSAQGLRVRPAAHGDGPGRPDLHFARSGRRRLQRRRGRGQDHQAAQAGRDEHRRADRPDPGPRLGALRGDVLRGRRPAGYVKIDGTTFHAPIYVGDPGAKGARPGDKVALEIVRYPTPYLEGEGVITELLGQRGPPGVDTLSVIRAFNIPDTFDEAVLDEARQQAESLL